MGDTNRLELLTVDEAFALDVAAVTELSRRHLGAEQYRRMQLLAFDTMLVDHAEGMYYEDVRGRRVLDFFTGFGAMAMGHNHPRILAVRRKFAEQRRHEIGTTVPSQYAAALATNLARIAPGELDVVQLCDTRPEVVETALRLTHRAQGPRRSGVVYAAQSLHGKALEALSAAGSTRHRSRFRLLNGEVRVPFGDAGALAAALRSRRIGTVILETVQGSAGVLPSPPGYLREVRRLCDEHGVLWIADEVQCGAGRTGRFFAFEHEGVVPDVVTMATSLGAGKAMVGAVIARAAVHRRAAPDDSSATVLGADLFRNLNEACYTALESLAVLYEEDLIGNAERTGRYLQRRLEGLRTCYPELVVDVRGMGLMVGVELAGISTRPPAARHSAAQLPDGRLPGGLAGVVGSLLLAEHGVLVALTEYNSNVLRLEPPLTVQPQHVDEFVDALDELLSRGPRQLALDYLRVVRGERVISSSPDSLPVTTRQ